MSVLAPHSPPSAVAQLSLEWSKERNTKPVADLARWGFSLLLVLLLLALVGCDVHPSENRPGKATGSLLPHLEPTGAGETSPHLQRLMQVSNRIFCGGEPHDDRAYAEIVRMGIGTVVSVDGARPDVDRARQHGLRYVHIPVGYDGIDLAARQALTRLMAEVTGPIYFHCHHGQHRGPAAAAIASMIEGSRDHDAARAILEQAGTSPSYAGLWRDVEEFKPIDVPIDQLPRLVEIAQVESFALAMAQLDRVTDQLQACRDAQWHTPPDHPDVIPVASALLMKEAFHEMLRQRSSLLDEYDERMLTWLTDMEKEAGNLEAELAAGEGEKATVSFAKIQTACKQCHQAYRN